MAEIFTHPVPPAWYELSSHLSGARAVSGVILDYLPIGEAIRPIYDQINNLGNLVGAVNDLLDLAEADAQALEAQLKTSTAERRWL
jgi:hypothetical protein